MRKGRVTLTAAQAANGDGMGALVASSFEQYQRPIFAYLARLVDDRDWAEELAEETLLAALRASHQVPSLADRRAWLFRIATDTALKALQRRNRFAWMPWSKRNALQLSGTNTTPAVAHVDAVERALASLPVRHRAPLLLYSHHELSGAELALVLGIGEGAVKARLYRARVLFREAYEREVQDARPR